MNLRMLAHRLQLCWTEQFRMIWEITESWPKGCVYNTYNHMHAKACQVSCSLITHSSGTPHHYGNPSILCGQNCVRKKKKTMVHTLPLPCNTMEKSMGWYKQAYLFHPVQHITENNSITGNQNVIPLTQFCFAHYKKKTHSTPFWGNLCWVREITLCCNLQLSKCTVWSRTEVEWVTGK